MKHEPYIRVERLSNGRVVTRSTFLLSVAAIYGQAHLPLVEGMSQAAWLAKELAENNGVFETGRGCIEGQTVRFSEVSSNEH